MPGSDTDQMVLGELQSQLLEVSNNGASVTSTMWSGISDFTTALNQAQNDWLKETGMVVSHLGYEDGSTNTGIGVVPGTEAVGLPQDCIDILRAAWIAYDTATPPAPAAITDLPRDDAWSLDNLQPGWENTLSAPPEEYVESISPVQQIYIAYQPSDIGAVDLLYVAVGAALSNTGVLLTVPDIGVSGVTWRALEYLLRKVGEAEDVNRADYAGLRYRENVALCKFMSIPPMNQSRWL